MACWSTSRGGGHRAAANGATRARVRGRSRAYVCVCVCVLKRFVFSLQSSPRVRFARIARIHKARHTRARITAHPAAHRTQQIREHIEHTHTRTHTPSVPQSPDSSRCALSTLRVWVCVCAFGVCIMLHTTNRLLRVLHCSRTWNTNTRTHTRCMRDRWEMHNNKHSRRIADTIASTMPLCIVNSALVGERVTCAHRRLWVWALNYCVVDSFHPPPIDASAQKNIRQTHSEYFLTLDIWVRMK